MKKKKEKKEKKKEKEKKKKKGKKEKKRKEKRKKEKRKKRKKEKKKTKRENLVRVPFPDYAFCQMRYICLLKFIPSQRQRDIQTDRTDRRRHVGSPFTNEEENRRIS